MSGSLQLQQMDFAEVSATLRKEWDALLRNSTRPSIYATLDYIELSIEHYVKPQGVEPFVLLMRDMSDGELRAIFPMSVVLRPCLKRLTRVLTHAITTRNSDVDKPYPIIHKDYENICWELFARYFKEEFTAWDWLDYKELIPESALNVLCRSLFRAPKFWVRQTPGPVSPLVDLSIGWETFWQSHRNMRKKYRRLQTRLGENFRVEILQQPQQMATGLAYYLQIEQLGWKAGKGISEVSASQFYEALLPRLASQGQAFIVVLFDGETAISAEISYAFCDQVYFAHGTYHPDYQHLSPGSVSTSRSLEFCFQQKYVQGDFLAGFAHYLNPWATSLFATQDCIVYKINRLFPYFAAHRIWLKLKIWFGFAERIRP